MMQLRVPLHHELRQAWSPQAPHAVLVPSQIRSAAGCADAIGCESDSFPGECAVITSCLAPFSGAVERRVRVHLFVRRRSDAFGHLRRYGTQVGVVSAHVLQVDVTPICSHYNAMQNMLEDCEKGRVNAIVHMGDHACTCACMCMCACAMIASRDRRQHRFLQRPSRRRVHERLPAPAHFLSLVTGTAPAQ